MIICNEAFGIYGPPNTTTVNKVRSLRSPPNREVQSTNISYQYGGYDISYPRLAFIDGEWDPWRPATPHAFGKERLSTTSASPALQNLEIEQQPQIPIIGQPKNRVPSPNHTPLALPSSSSSSKAQSPPKPANLVSANQTTAPPNAPQRLASLSS